MKITAKWLKENGACPDLYEWALKVLDGNSKSMDCTEFCWRLIKDNKRDWAKWVLGKVFNAENTTDREFIEYGIKLLEEGKKK